MSRITTLIHSFQTQPKYTLMRGLARFSSVRQLVYKTRGQMHSQRLEQLLRPSPSNAQKSVFEQVNAEHIAQKLRLDGVAFGLDLPKTIVQNIETWTQSQPSYADREPTLGFFPHQRAQLEEKLGKPILLAQYFNTVTQCQDIYNLSQDPVLLEIAARYLESTPSFVGANLWWTYPVKPIQADRMKHAHLFHRDVDDFRFLKFFFYLTDVSAGEGAHVCVAGSHSSPPKFGWLDQWNIRRYTDEEITAFYPQNNIQEICGLAGIGFAEDTLCVHKGSTPTKQARLLLQLQFALYDYGVMHDKRSASELSTFSI
jgi:hypothetical protein